MPNEDLDKTQELVRTALQLAPEKRDSFLQDTAAGDILLYEAAKARLDVMETRVVAPADMDQTVVYDGVGPASDSLLNRKTIGNYKLVRVLNTGGMGVVFIGTQAAEGFERTVAIKVVKPNLVTREIMERFKLERQFLSKLQHPNIAGLVDGGSTEDGIPYLVMEYVEGKPIDQYCNEKKLSIDDKLKLFISVCDAVQYAHQHLIIHRDIKPANILVTGDGTPKLLDFGIAKLVEKSGNETETIKLTTADARPMTPMYASPEQVKGDQITTASDIYSLAVLLYELLTGRLPYTFKSGTAAGIEHTICETAPTPPSNAELELHETEAVNRQRKRLRGDLDMILLMGLRKEPVRRYQSVFHFAQDIRNHLNGLPVSAHSDSVGYRVQKFVRRHRVGVIAASLAVLALLVSTIISIYFANVARAEKTVAERRFQETRELARFFMIDLDQAIRSGSTSVRRQVVEKGLAYLQRLAAEAGTDRSLQSDVLRGYVKMGDIQGNPFSENLGMRDKARESYQLARTALQEFTGISGGEGLKTEAAMITQRFADLDAMGGDSEKVIQQYEEASKDLSGLDLANLYIHKGFVHGQTGQFVKAAVTYSEALKAADEYRKTNPDNLEGNLTFAKAAERLGETLSYKTQYEEAVTVITNATSTYETVVAQNPERLPLKRLLGQSYLMLGDAYLGLKRMAQAEQSFSKSLLYADQLMAQDKQNTQYQKDAFAALSRLANVIGEQPGRLVEARQYTRRAIEIVLPIANAPGASDFERQLYAFILLNNPFPDLHNPRLALEIAERAANGPTGNYHATVDLLAQAYSDNGDHRRAIETEKKALEMLSKEGEGAESAYHREYTEKLRKFERRSAGQSK